MTVTEHTTPTADYIHFLRSLRAIRSFEDRPVPEAAIDDILEIARWSGSASNQQEWQFVVITDRDALQAIGEAAQTAHYLAKAPLAIAIVMPGERKIMEGFDEARVAERIMLAAHAHGLGSSIGWVGDGEERAKQALGIPAERKLRTVISIGYPDETGRRPKSAPGTARRPIDELVHRERW
jgi:nitroreductase